MRPIDRSEVLPIGEYEALRPHFRARVIAAKRERRVLVGDRMSAVFENRDTALMQIQEMLRTERITNEPAILHEIATYNELVPGDLELSLTLFVEVSDKDERDRLLVSLAGLEDAVRLEVDGEIFVARAAARPGAEPGRTTAVHYLKIPLTDASARSIRERQAKVFVAIDHPGYPVRAELGAAAVAQLAEDLA